MPPRRRLGCNQRILRAKVSKFLLIYLISKPESEIDCLDAHASSAGSSALGSSSGLVARRRGRRFSTGDGSYPSARCPSPSAIASARDKPIGASGGDASTAGRHVSAPVRVRVRVKIKVKVRLRLRVRVPRHYRRYACRAEARPGPAGHCCGPPPRSRRRAVSAASAGRVRT